MEPGWWMLQMLQLLILMCPRGHCSPSFTAPGPTLGPLARIMGSGPLSVFIQQHLRITLMYHVLCCCFVLAGSGFSILHS